jgi:hypothetical protein
MKVLEPLRVCLTNSLCHTVRSSGPGLELAGPSLCQGRIRFSMQPLRFRVSCGCTGGLLQGVGIAGQLASILLENMAAIAGGGVVHGRKFYGILFKFNTYKNAIEL